MTMTCVSTGPFTGPLTGRLMTKPLGSCTPQTPASIFGNIEKEAR